MSRRNAADDDGLPSTAFGGKAWDDSGRMRALEMMASYQVGEDERNRSKNGRTNGTWNRNISFFRRLRRIVKPLRT
jgi:hypothetical protein